MPEKYLVCSDIHDDVEALEKFADFAQAEEADRILVLGDFSLRPYTIKDLKQLNKIHDTERFIEAKRKHAQSMLTEMKAVLEKTGIPYTVIPGNYDSNDDVEAVFQEKNLHKKTTTFGEADVFGYGGADFFPEHIWRLHELGEITHFDEQELYNLLEIEMPDVILAHNPPHHFCDDTSNGKNVGAPAETKHIIKFSPRLALVGHIHEAGPHGNNPNRVKGFNGYQNKGTGEVTIVLNPGNLGRFEEVRPKTLTTGHKFDYGTFLRVDVEGDGIPKKVFAYSLKATGRKIGQVKTLEERTL